MTALVHAAASLAQAAANMTLTLSRLSVPAWMMRGVTVIKNLGPYAAIEILLPGGTLIAITLWLYRSYRKRKAAGIPMTLVPVAS
ncbi:MAG: hypothetical protein ACREUC_00195 [Steroidobacteraceae bacterium]